MVASEASSMLSSSQPRRRVRVGAARVPISRPPVVMELGATVCRVGYAGDAHPRRHVLTALGGGGAHLEDTAASTDPSTTTVGPSMFATMAWLTRMLFDQMVQDPTERRLIIVTEGLFVETSWKETLLKAVWNLGVPAVSFLPALQQLPAAVPVSTGVICLVSAKEAHCAVFAEETMLPFTYQVVPYSDAKLATDSTDPNSTVNAILKCLELCPREVRKTAISNLLFAGEMCAYEPDLDRMVASALRDCLRRSGSGKDTSASAEASHQDPAAPESSSDDIGNGEAQTTAVPVQLEQLRPLADSVGVLRTPYRPDLLPFVGTSIWATYWHNISQQGSGPSTGPVTDPVTDAAAVFHWILKPSNS